MCTPVGNNNFDTLTPPFSVPSLDDCNKVARVALMSSAEQIQIFNTFSSDTDISSTVLKFILGKLEESDCETEYVFDLLDQMQNYLDPSKTDVIKNIFEAILNTLDNEILSPIFLHPFFNTQRINSLGLSEALQNRMDDCFGDNLFDRFLADTQIPLRKYNALNFQNNFTLNVDNTLAEPERLSWH